MQTDTAFDEIPSSHKATPYEVVFRGSVNDGTPTFAVVWVEATNREDAIWKASKTTLDTVNTWTIAAIRKVRNSG